MMTKQHQELKVKIDGRSKTIQQCADLGKILIAAGDPASDEVCYKQLHDRVMNKPMLLLMTNATHLNDTHMLCSIWLNMLRSFDK